MQAFFVFLIKNTILICNMTKIARLASPKNNFLAQVIRFDYFVNRINGSLFFKVGLFKS